LTQASGLRTVRSGDPLTTDTDPLLGILPALLFLPLGVILLWPLFYTTQRLLGRPQHLTAGEWLWGVAWLLTLALGGWIAWKHWGAPPEALVSVSFKKYVVVGYVLASLSLGVFALLTLLVGLVGRWPQPW